MPHLALLLPLLVAAAWCDLRFLRIPNTLVVAALLLFAVLVPSIPWPELGWRLVAAGAVFLAGFTGFALGLVGGGDVKMLPVMLLFVPPGALPLFALALSAGILLTIALVTTLKTVSAAKGSGWAALAPAPSLPMGVAMAIAAGGMVVM